MKQLDAAPGGYAPSRDVWGSFSSCARRLPEGALVVLDRRVERLHPDVVAALARRRPRAVVRLTAGERAKTLSALARVLSAGALLPRAGTLLCVGGGTLGDLSTVAAHLLKRGVRLVQAPTTLLAAVDSSLGGKGAVHVEAGPTAVKNGAGVFHYAEESWLCPELFRTLSERQLREGKVEAWKMAVCLDASLWGTLLRRPPPLRRLVQAARALKEQVCGADPYERSGLRRVLNFGHTFGHVIESVTGFQVSHGDAVALGILCALDVGRALGVTAEATAREVEDAFGEGLGAPDRKALRRALSRCSRSRAEGLLAADKKAGARGQLQMVLLEAPGSAVVREVEASVWSRLWSAWRDGTRP